VHSGATAQAIFRALAPTASSERTHRSRRNWYEYLAPRRAIDGDRRSRLSTVCWPPAYRTPPVRGQDRVHLNDVVTQGSYEPPFARDERTRA
jgi:hypothetical protein